MDPFYIVMCDTAQTSISTRHVIEDDARDEAERLCKKTGKCFIVLKAVACVQVAELPVKWVAASSEE